jgi:hypothetical protein
MEQRTEVKTIRVDLICDTCGTGEMAYTGTILMSDPPQRQYQCPECLNIAHVPGRLYPRIEYKEIDKFDQSSSMNKFI